MRLYLCIAVGETCSALACSYVLHNTNIVFWRPWWRGRWIHRLITRIILSLSLDVAILVLKAFNRFSFQEFGIASRRYTD